MEFAKCSDLTLRGGFRPSVKSSHGEYSKLGALSVDVGGGGGDGGATGGGGGGSGGGGGGDGEGASGGSGGVLGASGRLLQRDLLVFLDVWHRGMTIGSVSS